MERTIFEGNHITPALNVNLHYGCINSNFYRAFFKEHGWFDISFGELKDKLNALSEKEAEIFVSELYPEKMRFTEDNILFKGIKRDKGIEFSWMFENHRVGRLMNWYEIVPELKMSINYRFYETLPMSDDELKNARYSDYEAAKNGLCITQDELYRYLTDQVGYKTFIYRHFKKDRKSRENDAVFLKNLFGTGGASGGYGYERSFDSKGFKLSRKRFIGDSSCEVLYTWNEMAKNYDYLVNQTEYFTETDFISYKNDLWYDAKWSYRDEKRVYIKVPRTSTISVDDIVYVNGSKCQILGIDNDVVSVSDVDFPLFVDSYEIPALENLLKKDGRNNLDREMTPSEFYEKSFYTVIGFLKESIPVEEYMKKNITDDEVLSEIGHAIKKANDDILMQWYKYSVSFRNFLKEDIMNYLTKGVQEPNNANSFEDTSPFLWVNRMFFDIDHSEMMDYIENYVNNELFSEKNEVFRMFFNNSDNSDGVAEHDEDVEEAEDDEMGL